MKSKVLLVLFAIALAAVTATWLACSSDGTVTPNESHVRILLTDKPLDLSTVSAVNVTLERMILFQRNDNGDEEAHPMRTPGVVAGEGLTVNLLELRDGNTTLIADGEVPAGEYLKLRMEIASAELVYDDDGDPDTPEVTSPIFVPSGKVDVPVPFTVSEGEDVEIVLDFDAELSVQVNETPGMHPFILRPVVTPVGVTVR